MSNLYSLYLNQNNSISSFQIGIFEYSWDVSVHHNVSVIDMLTKIKVHLKPGIQRRVFYDDPTTEVHQVGSPTFTVVLLGE